MPPLISLVPPLTLGETILERLHENTTQGDVTFVFDEPEDPLPFEPGLFTEDGLEKVVNSGSQRRHQGSCLRSHKLILSQRPYFKTMFEGEVFTI